MFYLSKIEHTIPLPPHLLSRPLVDAIKEQLEKLFLDKVIANLGLCISIYDIQSIEGGFVYPGHGCPTYKVIFRSVMFRPFVGEILTGKIEESGVNGLRLSLGFFNDIYVHVHLLQHPCQLGPDDIWTWTWTYDSSELPLDLDEKIRFRVKSIKYPPLPIEQDADAKPFAPMAITAEICADGLGLVSWWEE